MRVRLIWGIEGVLLFAGAVFTLAMAQDDFGHIAPLLGLVMLLCGGLNGILHLCDRRSLHGARWILADGMIAALLSIFLLCNREIPSAMIPFFFGVWELVSGVIKFVDSRELKEKQVRGWYGFAIIGIVGILSGVAALLKPVDDFVGMNRVVAGVLLLQSIGYWFKILMYPRLAVNNEQP